MKKLLALSTLFIIVFSACQQENKDQLQASADQPAPTAKISGIIENPGSEEVMVYFKPIHHTLKSQKSTATLDENGQFSLEIEVPQAGYAIFYHGKESSSMYLTGNEELTVSLDYDMFDETIKYQGSGAEVNNYLASKLITKENILNEAEVKNIYMLDTEKFMETSDKIFQQQKKQLEETLHDKQFEEFRKLELIDLHAGLAVERLTFKEYYGYYHEGQFVAPEGYEAPIEKAKSLKTALNSLKYRDYVVKTFEQKVREEITSADEELTQLEIYEQSLLKAYPMAQEEEDAEKKEFLSTVTILNRMSYFGNKDIEEHIANYKENYKNSISFANVLSIHEKWGTIAKGKAAPDFTYVNNSGEQVSLSDFKGNVVYIDVWATWCGPCMKEMPHSKKLKEVFKDAEDVTFMYVSVDDTKEVWEKYLAKNPEFTGTLLWADGWSEITDDYIINGIPRFILIDKQGNIVDAMAPRPSSGDKIKAMIEEARTQTVESI